eukprot:6851733-Prymnesium_polylepis.1
MALNRRVYAPRSGRRAPQTDILSAYLVQLRQLKIRCRPTWLVAASRRPPVCALRTRCFPKARAERALRCGGDGRGAEPSPASKNGETADLKVCISVATASSRRSFWHHSRPETPLLRSITDPRRRVASGRAHRQRSV